MERPIDRQAIHAALEKHQGDRKAAAADLGCTALVLKDKINNCQELRARWSASKRKGPDDPLDPEKVDEQFALAVKERGLGLDHEGMDAAAAFQRFQNRNVFGTANMMAGGVAAHFIKLSQVLNTKMVEVIQGYDGEPEHALMKERMGLDFVLKGNEVLRKMAADQHKNSLARAKYQQALRGRSGQGKVRKPGFTKLTRPTQVVAQPGSTVNIE